MEKIITFDTLVTTHYLITGIQNQKSIAFSEIQTVLLVVYQLEYLQVETNITYFPSTLCVIMDLCEERLESWQVIPIHQHLHEQSTASAKTSELLCLLHG